MTKKTETKAEGLDLEAIRKSLKGAVADTLGQLMKEPKTVKYLAKFESQEELVAHIEKMVALTAQGNAELEAALAAGAVEVDTSGAVDDTPTYSFGKDIAPMGILGPVEYLGTMPMTSGEFKENWEEKIIEGRTLYGSKKHKFRNVKDGSEFFIHNAPMMNNVLRCLPTKESPLTCDLVHANPVVFIKYLGKIDREVAKNEYGFEFTQGDETHGVKVILQDRSFDHFIERNRYAKGAVNWLAKPWDLKESGEYGVDEMHDAWDAAQARLAGKTAQAQTSEQAVQ